MLNASRRVLLLLLATPLLLCGCSTAPLQSPPPKLVPLWQDDGFIAIRTPFIEQQLLKDVLKVTPEMQLFLDRHVLTLRGSNARVAALTQAIFSKGVLALDYQADATKTAADTFSSGRGNCLSFANLYIALARQADITANYQQVVIKPNWNQSGNLLISNRHINVRLRMNSQRNLVIDFIPYRNDEIHRSHIISDQSALSQYFSNVGVEALQQGDDVTAYFMFVKAMEVDPGESFTWVNLGLVYRRNGQYQAAEQAYLYAISLDKRQYSAYNNLAQLYHRQGRHELAQSYKDQILRNRRKNPYYHYTLASDAYKQGFYDAAIDHLVAAIRRKDDEHRFYHLLALNYQGLMRLGDSLENLNLALIHAKDKADKIVYQQLIADISNVSVSPYN